MTSLCCQQYGIHCRCVMRLMHVLLLHGTRHVRMIQRSTCDSLSYFVYPSSHAFSASLTIKDELAHRAIARTLGIEAAIPSNKRRTRTARARSLDGNCDASAMLRCVGTSSTVYSTTRFRRVGLVWMDPSLNSSQLAVLFYSRQRTTCKYVPEWNAPSRLRSQVGMRS